MLESFNPLEWLKSAQNWFSRTEKSSGFRPFLIFMILVFGMAICLLTFFQGVKYAAEVALFVIVVPVVVFIALFSIKSHTDPDFCRSERHIQKMMKLELESMGSEMNQVEGEVLEAELLAESSKEMKKLSSSANTKEVE
jgi:uncharacterized membrane protein